MSWAETLKINSNMRKPLDKATYEMFYMLAILQNGGYGTNKDPILIVPDYKETIDTAEYSNGNMKIVVLPQTIINIGTRGFDQCTNLETIFIPNGVEIISGFAFRGCTKLNNIRLPASIKVINSLAFSDSVQHIFVPWNEGSVDGAPWGATNAMIHYNS